MKKPLWIFVLSILAATAGFAQEPLTKTAVPETSRFEIIQPAYEPGTTFRLDKFTGAIHRLSTCPKDDTTGSNKCWKEMTVIEALKIHPSANQVRFQIVVNNPLKMIMLFNVESGQSWQYGIESRDRWYPFIECTDRTDYQCLWKPGN